ncbi:MAG: neurogenic locus notch [Tatlockia sp.]|nr:neurogenic locus notch [Tatlockia sp.]
MRFLVRLLLGVAFLSICSISQAAQSQKPASCNFIPFCDKQLCCNDMGGISYCDSSAGRYVCNNGYYSVCYCTRHAVMDLQKIEGCCLWQGGVMTTSVTGHVICNNGGISELCSQTPIEPVASW